MTIQACTTTPAFIAWVILLAVLSVFITPAFSILVGIILAGVNVAALNSNRTIWHTIKARILVAALMRQRGIENVYGHYFRSRT